MFYHHYNLSFVYTFIFLCFVCSASLALPRIVCCSVVPLVVRVVCCPKKFVVHSLSLRGAEGQTHFQSLTICACLPRNYFIFLCDCSCLHSCLSKYRAGSNQDTRSTMVTAVICTLHYTYSQKNQLNTNSAQTEPPFPLLPLAPSLFTRALQLS